jgi:ribosomal protein S18 acetylase RimI-like enzyme
MVKTRRAVTPVTWNILEPSQALEWDQARSLLHEYLHSLRMDATFLNIEEEVATLPGGYAASRGGFWMAQADGVWAGCCGLAPLDGTDYPNACELRRLYVRPAMRQQNLGLMLTEHALDRARMHGYKHVLLDTLSDMEAARALYQGLGFKEIPPYYFNPIPGAHYLMATL